jgi:hypothetical protein
MRAHLRKALLCLLYRPGGWRRGLERRGCVIALRRGNVARLRVDVARIGRVETVDRRPRTLRRGREAATRGFDAIGPGRLDDVCL